MPTEHDLFAEEQHMVAMSFGDHLEELRMRLILALLGLAVGMTITLLPPLNLGMSVMKTMEVPAQEAMNEYNKRQAEQRASDAEKAQSMSRTFDLAIPVAQLDEQLRKLYPELKKPAEPLATEATITLAVSVPQSDLIRTVTPTLKSENAVISLAPMEPVVVFLMVCLVAGLVLSSPWVFYQIWAFVAAGLYRHERRSVYKFLPFSLGLFLAGVFLCFFFVLPLTLRVLFEFNVWLGIDPRLRITDWMVFASLLPLVFGICFQTPLVMVFLARIGVFTVEDYREKRRYAILIIVVIAAVLTPDPTIISQLLLAVPMIALYELGIVMVSPRKAGPAPFDLPA